ncbi:MAG: hypothetical protein ACOC0R_00150 [Mariniphaga sp.]
MKAWFIVFEEKAVRGDRVQFLRKQKKAVDVWKLHHRNVPVFVWQSDDNILYRMIPIRSFASLDTLYRKMEAISKIINADSLGPDEIPASLSTVSGSVMTWMPELSHQQSSEFSEFAAKPYIEWMFVYLISGQEQKAEEALQRFRDYYAQNNLNYPWDTFRVLMGNNTPLLIGRFRAESPAALQAKGKKIWEKHGSELEKLWNNVVQHTWKIENKSGWFNPSLSNLPVAAPGHEVAGGF